MKNLVTIIALTIALLSAVACSTTRPLSGNLRARIGTSRDWIYYYQKSATIPDSGSPWIAIADLEEHTVEVTTRDTSSRVSTHYYFVPGNSFTVWLSGDIDWSEEEGLFAYSYELRSDSSSVTSVDFFRLEKTMDCRQMLGPPGWVAHDFGESYDWSNFRENDMLKPGGTIAGFGFKTGCPPRLGKFEIWGAEIEMSGAGWDEDSWSIPATIAGENRDVSGITIVPGPCPEMIEPVDLTDLLMYSLWKLVDNGYMDRETEYAVHMILNNLKGAMLHRSEHKFQNLEQHVNDALNALEEYHEVMQPEAWGYITENLKYMLKHPNIVVFKRAMWD